ncbi:MAG: anthranilate synthase component II [Enterobacteriaceae bacterium]
MLLLIDNYDSFTYNLYHYFCELQCEVQVVRNDQLSLHDIEALAPEKIVISPGPGRPQGAGITLAMISHFAGRIPVLGICLGHQAIGEAFGAKVVRAQQVMHGKTSRIEHNGQGLFRDLNHPLTVTRYHSLLLEWDSLPDSLEVTAWSVSQDQPYEIMGIQHRQLPLYGVQFHPESILSEQGHQLLSNFLSL